MIATAFHNRSGRIVASLRLVLAAIFLVALYFDPEQPARQPIAGYILLGAYTGWAAALLAVAWRSWWYEFRLRAPAFLVDILVFALSVSFTEGASKEFNSPFLAFFVFLMVSAVLRFDRRRAFILGAAVIASYLAVGLLLAWQGIAFDPQQFLRRISYMFVILLAFAWFAMQRSGPTVARALDTGDEDVFEHAMDYILEQANGARAALLWEGEEEPAMLFGKPRGGALEVVPASPPRDSGHARPMMFDRREGRRIVLEADGRLSAERASSADPLLERLDFCEGVVVPLRASGRRAGRLAVAPAGVMATEEIERAVAIGHEVVWLLQRRQLAQLASRSAIVGTRAALARDLHDSVAQSLAGASFALEALRRSIDQPREVLVEKIDRLKDGLRKEQRAIRQIIERLRLEGEDVRAVSLGAEVRRVVEEDKARWQVEIIAEADEQIHVPAKIAFELTQLLREAVANAVRHGGARNISVRVSPRHPGIGLSIRDDGKGFPADWDGSTPWSIRQRVEALTGTMAVTSEPGTTVVDVTIARGGQQ